MKLLKPFCLAAALTLLSPVAASINETAASFFGGPSVAFAFSEGDPRLNRWLGVNTRRVKWCGLYLGTQVKNPPPRSTRASVDTWRRWGRRVAPRPGVAAIFKHRHVGLVVAVRKGCVLVRSGNDGNRVRTRCRKPSSIRDYRTNS